MHCPDTGVFLRQSEEKMEIYKRYTFCGSPCDGGFFDYWRLTASETSASGGSGGRCPTGPTGPTGARGPTGPTEQVT